MLIGYDDASLTATYAGGTWYGDLTPANQLTDRLITAQARTTSSTALTLSVTLAASVSARLIAIINHNCTAAGTYRVRAYSGVLSSQVYTSQVSGSSSVVPTPVTNYTPIIVADMGENRTIRSFDITLTQASLAYFEIGRLFVGPALDLSTNAVLGDEMYVEDLSRANESSSGIRLYDSRGKRRRVNATLSGLSDAKRDSLLDLQAASGITTDVLYIGHPHAWGGAVTGDRKSVV